MKAKHHQPERVQIETIKKQVDGSPASTGAIGNVAQAMGWSQGQAADFLQSGREPLQPV
jgi:hypothetical protein